jgi:hypothetical protein
MTIPAPVPGLQPIDRLALSFRERLTAACPSLPSAILEAALIALVLDAREYAAAMIEQYARPDNRWRASRERTD